MNETIQTLISRRSIRSYKPDQISDEALQQIIAAGEFAPSGKSLQPVTIAVTQNPAVIARLSAMNAKIMGVTSDPFYGAPTLCIIFADMQKSANAWSDACLVLGNMMNAAASLGIGSCWINRSKEEFESPEGKELLRQWGLPEHLVGVGHCILGYAKGEAAPAKPRKADFVKVIE